MPIPPDTRSAGDPGHITDHNNIADVLTALTATSAQLAGDLGGTASSPQVTSTHLATVTNSAATGTVNLDPTSTRVFKVTETGNVTFTFTSGSSFTSGVSYSFVLYLSQDATGGRTTTWPGSVTWIGGPAPTLLTTASALNVLVFETINGGTTWYGSMVTETPALPLTVANGGIGGSSLGAYQVLAGGVTTTSPVQAVSGTGTSGQVLTSAGASALPGWQTPAASLPPNGSAGGALTGTYPNPGLATVAIASGGTGQTTQAAALTALAGAQSAGKVLRSDGTNTALANLQASDVPTLNQSTTGTAAGLSSTLAVGSGGTGQTTQQAAIDALSGTQSTGKVLRSDGTHATLSAIQAGDVPTLNQSTTGTAAGLSATLAVGSGGTGQTTQQAAIDALTGTQSAGTYLRSNGTHAALAAIQAADVPTLNQSTSGTSANVTGTVALANGGTGSTTRNFAGLLTPTAVKTTAYTAAAGDYVPCDTTSGAFTVTLPSAPADLTVVGVKHIIQGSTNVVTFACGGTDVFNKTGGGTTGTLPLVAQGVLLQYRASGGIWYILSDDLPLSQLDSRYVTQSSLPLAITSGGTGQTTQQAAINALTGTQSAGKVLRSDGTNAGLANLQASDVPTLNQSTTGTAAGLSATLAIASGGTGATSAAAGFNALSPMTTTGDLEYEASAGTAGRLAIGSAGQILTPASGAPAWRPPNSWQTLYIAPTGATAETITRHLATTATGITSGTLYLHAIGLPAGLTVSNITMCTGGTAKSGGTHGWYCILDSSFTLRGVTADQTDAATTWGTTNSAQSLALASAYTTTYAGVYYLGVMVAATTMPTFDCTAPLASGMNVAPYLAGSSSTGLTTPGTTGSTTYTALSVPTATGKVFYAYTS